MLPNIKYQVQQTIYDPKSMQDEQNLYHQRNGSPSELTRKLTYIIGDYTKKYPLTMATLGAVGYGAGKSAVELNDVQFTYPVMAGLNKVCRTSHTTYSGGDKPGVGHSHFFLWFPDNWIKRFFIIQSERGVQAYVLEDPIADGSRGFKYKVQLDPADEDDFCPISQVSENVAWTALTTNVAESESRTTEGNSVAPGMFKNQMGFLRYGMSWAGNASNLMMKISMEGKNKEGKSVKFDGHMDWFMWQFEQNWLDIRENAYWYSRYNRKADGSIPLKDLVTGKVIPRGAGALEQIQNKATYTTLTYNFLSNVIGDALYGQEDSSNMTITLMTGKGGLREFDRMAKAAGGTIVGDFANVADKFVTGTGYNLALGGYFTTMYHIDGYIITVKHNPLFDTGQVAQASPKHPVTGLPLESYRMVFLDTNDVDGQPNIQHVAQKGRSFLHGVVAGLTPMPKSLRIAGGFAPEANEAAALMSTDQDKSLYTRFASCGIQILRANRCFDLTCEAGL